MASQLEKVRVLVFQEDGAWVAQCLEYDVGAQAASLEELRVRFDAVFMAECHESLKVNGKPFAGIDPAPEHFQNMWDQTSGVFTPKNAASNAPRYEMAMVA